MASQDFRWDAARTQAQNALDIYRQLPAAERSAHYAYPLFAHAEVSTHDGDHDAAYRAVGLAVIGALGEGDRAAAERYASEGLDVARAYRDEEVAAGCRLILQSSS